MIQYFYWCTVQYNFMWNHIFIRHWFQHSQNFCHCLWGLELVFLFCCFIPSGSSAGAGSGEFHVYRHLRRREYQRQDFLERLSDKVCLSVTKAVKSVEVRYLNPIAFKPCKIKNRYLWVLSTIHLNKIVL